MATLSRKEAQDLIEAYLESRDESIFADAIADLKTHDDEGNFAIMLGSGNEASPFIKALYLFKKAGLINQAESTAYIRRT